jgi:hypothetical protein
MPCANAFGRILKLAICRGEQRLFRNTIIAKKRCIFAAKESGADLFQKPSIFAPHNNQTFTKCQTSQQE